MDITQFMQNAVNAKNSGTPVNWEAVAMTVYQAMGEIITERDGQIAALTPEVPAEAPAPE